MNPTNDPALRSFVPVAPESHFPIQNLPYGVFKRKTGGSGAVAHAGVAIGDYVLDLAMLLEQRLLRVAGAHERNIFAEGSLNTFMSLGPKAWRDTRAAITKLLRHDEPTLRDNSAVFGDFSKMPRHAISMGVGTIMDARRLLLLAVPAARKQREQRRQDQR